MAESSTEARLPALTWDVPEPRKAGGDAGAGNLVAELSNIALQHRTAILAEQLKNLLPARRVAEWLPVISRLATGAADALSPSALVANGDSDPRNYIEVGREGAAQWGTGAL